MDAGDLKDESTMKTLAERLTGMSLAEAQEYEFAGAGSSADVFRESQVPARQNVRLGSNEYLVGMDDRNSCRRHLANSVPSCLKPLAG